MSSPHDAGHSAHNDVTSGHSLPGLDRAQRLGLLAGLVGLGVTAGLSLINGGDSFFRAYFYGFLFWLAFPLASIGLLCINHIAFGTWGVLIRRLLESSAATIALTVILALPILSPMGLHALYPWANAGHAEGESEPGKASVGGTSIAVEATSEASEVAHDTEHEFHSPMGHKAAWFQPGFFYGRAIGYFLVWGTLAFLLNSWSKEQDRSDDPGSTRRLQLLGAPGLILLFLTATFALFDWSMSLDTNWYSTIYGAMLLVGMAQATLAFSLMVLTKLVDAGAYGTVVTATRLRDLGNLLLALTMLWAYTSFSQFLIMWSGNLAEEVTWYLKRSQGGWQFVVGFLMLFGFFGPFIALLFRGTKQSTSKIRGIATFILGVHIVDVLWLVGPDLGISKLTFAYLGLVLQCLAALVGVGGLWLATYTYFLRGKKLLPQNDPGLIAVLEEDHAPVHGHAHPA